MDAAAISSASAPTPPALVGTSVLLPIDTSPPNVLINDRMVAIRLIASLSSFVGQRLDTNA